MVKGIVYSSCSAKIFLRTVLKLHSKTYFLAGAYATILNNSVHPKHNILKYKEWFRDNIEVGWVVFDVGCNTGQLPYLLAKKAKYVYGIEKNEMFIREAKANRQKSNIEYIFSDALKYDYSNFREIDCITLSNVLEHIHQRVEFLKMLLGKVKWSNSRNKVFLIRVPMIEREWITIYKKELGLDYRLDKTHFIEYTFQEFVKELLQAGIEISKFQIKFGEIYAVCRAKNEC